VRREKRLAPAGEFGRNDGGRSLLATRRKNRSKHMKKLIVLCLILGSFTLNIPTVSAAEGAPPSGEKGEKKSTRHVPFHGKVETVDKSAGTLKVGERTFHVTAGTKITKDGKPATFDQTTIGEEVGGAFQQSDGGRLELTSLRIGPKPAKEGKPEEKKD
jgi:hypothetical protein